jgi:hypothetical protein
MALKIIGMGAGIGKDDSFITEIIKKNPIIFNMTFSESAVITGKRMLTATFRQRFFPNNFNQNIKKLVSIITAFFHKLEVFFKLVGKLESKHRLNAQIFPRFLKGFKPFCRYLPASYIFGFLHGGKDFSVKRRVFGVKGAIVTVYARTPLSDLGSGLYSSLFGGHSGLLCLKYNSFFKMGQV